MKLPKQLLQVLFGLLMVGTLSSLLLLNACSSDDEGVNNQPVAVAFANTTGNILESSTAQLNINMVLAEQVRRDGTIEVTITNGPNTTEANYTTTPQAVAGKIIINVAAGATSTGFTFRPINNEEVDGDKTVTFTLTAATGGLVLGTNTSFVATILDDDTEEPPVQINFAEASRTIAENGSATTVTINLAEAAPVAGTISVAVANAEGTTNAHYTTTPAIEAGRINLTVNAAATSASFTVTPVNNTEVDNDKVITFTLVETSDVFTIGAANQFVLTIENDDVAPSVMSIAQLRALHTGSTVTIPDNTFIEAVLSSTNQNVTARNAWFQDATGGILIRFTANNAIERGRNVRVNVGGASLELFSGVLQVGGSGGIANALVQDLGAGTLPTPQVITIDQLRSDEFQGLLVKIENVSFPAADGTRTLRYNSGPGAGNNVFTDGTSEGVFRVESYAPFANEVLPLGAGDLLGIASRFNDVFQITPQVPTDIFASSASSVITVTGGPLAFGDVANGEQSAAESFSVSGQDLLGDITVTAPAQFQVSLAAEGPFSSSVTVEKAAAEAGQVQVYVVFKPASGVDGLKEGNVSLTSLGAEPKTVAVSGTETGNEAGAALILVENFEYGDNDNDDLLGVTTNWLRHSGTAGPKYVSQPLVYEGYPNSGVGGSVWFTHGGSSINDGDVSRPFPMVNSNQDIYVSFLVNLESARTADYFFHLGPDPVGTAFRGRVFARSNEEGYSLNFGKSANTETSEVILDFNKTYLFVLKYTFNTTASNDDLVSLSVFENSIPSSMSDSPVVEFTPVGNAVADGVSNIGTVSIRQGANTPTGKIDGIRVSLDWDSLFTTGD